MVSEKPVNNSYINNNSQIVCPTFLANRVLPFSFENDAYIVIAFFPFILLYFRVLFFFLLSCFLWWSSISGIAVKLMPRWRWGRFSFEQNVLTIFPRLSDPRWLSTLIEKLKWRCYFSKNTGTHSLNSSPTIRLKI